MPLTEFQRGIARLIASNRKPESHIAGGAAINRGETALRISNDLDIFHDVVKGGPDPAELVAAFAEADAELLRGSRYSVDWVFRKEALYRAVVSRDGETVRLDWTTDSAFRFFPVQEDEEFGYCLHRADLAINKVLALAGWTEIRDFLDILQLDREYLSLGAVIWAACGKDEGFTPSIILDLTNRHSSYRQSDLADEYLVRQVDLKELKRQWIEARERAEAMIDRLPPQQLGCLYLDPEHRPVTPDPDSPDFPNLIRHWGRPGGAWPPIS